MAQFVKAAFATNTWPCARGSTMKLREFFYMLGLKPKARTYGYEIKEQKIDGQSIRYADWLHPRAYPCAVNQAEVRKISASSIERLT
jgi:hypothetical protein